MSKNKYAKEAVTTGGSGVERKSRDHSKTGKLARRRENRRLEAIGRQVQRIQLVEAGMAGDKSDPEIVGYIKGFDVAADAVIHSKKTLSKIRGGVPHSQLDNTVFKGDTTTNSATQTAPAQPEASEKSKSKYKQKRNKHVEAAAPSVN